MPRLTRGLSNWRGGRDGLIRLCNKERKKDSEFKFEALQHLEVGRGFPWWLNPPMQETWVWSLIQEDSTSLRATESDHHNYWACALEPESCNEWAHLPQLLKPVCPRARTPQHEKQLQWETCVLQLESSPRSPTREKLTQQWRPSTAINK